MVPMDTWAVVAVTGDTVLLDNVFYPSDEPWEVPTEEIGTNCCVGDILSTETGGWVYLEYVELANLTDEGRRIFWDYIREKGFHYTFLEKYGFIADRG